MPTLHMDLIEGSKLDSTGGEVSLVRMAKVTGIDCYPQGGTQYDPNVLLRSLATAGLPQKGELHPSIANCWVDGHICVGRKDLGNNLGPGVEIQVVYKTPSPGTPVIAGWQTRSIMTLTQVITEMTGGVMNPGEAIVVDYTPDPIPGGALAPGNSIQKIARLPKYIPTQTLVASKLSANPISLDIENAVGSVNQSDFRGHQRCMWMLYGSDSNPQGNGEYENILTFWRNPETWYGFAIYRGSDGEIPTSPIPDHPSKLRIPSALTIERGNGSTLASIYPENDFTSLFPALTSRPTAGGLIQPDNNVN